MMRDPLLISSLVAHAARNHADTEIVSVDTSGASEVGTWGSIERNARRLASALKHLGVKHGECCATIAWNNRRHLEIYYAVSGGGMVCHTINPRLAPETLIYVINHAEDQVIFIDRTFLQAVAKLLPQLKTLKHVVLMGPREPEALAIIPTLLFYDDLVVSGEADYEWPIFDENTPSSLCYTSGTTGHPKGVLYSHRSTVLHSLGANGPDGLAISARDSVMPVVPMFHVNAWGVPYIAAAQGTKLVLPGPFLDGDSLAALIDKEEVTLALGVPTIWMGLLSALRQRGTRPKRLTRSVIGGSALPPSLFTAFRDEFGIELIQGWGMTETSPLGAINRPLAKHSALPAQEQDQLRLSQGRPPYGVQLRVVGVDGQELPRDGKSQGDLQVRGFWIVDTYFKTDKSAQTDDGWFDTGDIATLDGDGYLVIRDRAKDLIKSGGEWISSVELENLAMSHPDVQAAAAIGVPHPKWDERPVVVAIMREGAVVGEEELRLFIAEKVPSWQVPDRVVLVDSLPLGGTGKVLKNKLREAYAGLLADAGQEASAC
jgi:acyl-CoA synthetase (AMP-forming)/AMP-acid ligase II